VSHERWKKGNDAPTTSTYLILRLIIGTGVSNARNGELSVLDAIVLGSTLAKRTSIHANDGGMALRENSKSLGYHINDAKQYRENVAAAKLTK
jgi:hypothetical protein